jgi:hypothetical protein
MTTQDKEHNEVINDQYHKYSYEEPKNVTSPNDLYDLTPFGINKVLNKELPVVLQVIDIMEKTLTAREKVTLIEPDGSTTFFFAEAQNPAVSNAARSKIILPDGKVYLEEEEHMNTRPVFPLFHVSDGVHFVQAIIRKHPLANKCFTAGLKSGSIITITRAVTSFFRGSVGLLEIYDFNVSHLKFHVLGNPVPFPDTTIDLFKDYSTNVCWTTYPMTYSGLPGLRLVSGKWILEEDDNCSDDITTLMTMRTQFIDNWTSRASKPVSTAKKQKKEQVIPSHK